MRMTYAILFAGSLSIGCGAKPKPVAPPAPPPAQAAPQPDPCENRVIDPADNPDADTGAAAAKRSLSAQG